jgi:hypothetical protein
LRQHMTSRYRRTKRDVNADTHPVFVCCLTLDLNQSLYNIRIPDTGRTYQLIFSVHLNCPLLCSMASELMHPTSQEQYQNDSLFGKLLLISLLFIQLSLHDCLT